MKNNAKARYYSLYRDHRPYHVLRWNLRKLGRSIAFLNRYAGTSQQRRVLAEDAVEVGLIDSTQSVGKPHTRGSGQQCRDRFMGCYTNTTEVAISHIRAKFNFKKYALKCCRWVGRNFVGCRLKIPDLHDRQSSKEQSDTVSNAEVL